MRSNVLELARLVAQFAALRGKLRKRLLAFVQALEGGLHACHHGAIELHLLAHVPIERARDMRLSALNDGILQAGWPRVHRADAGHFGLRGVARMQQRHQIGQRDGLPGRAVGIARAHPVADFGDDRR